MKTVEYVTKLQNPERNQKVWTIEDFWTMADAERMSAEYLVDRDLTYLQIASPEELKRIFVQYRFFTIFYISDLALLLSKMPFGTLRSSLARFLSEELGDGVPDRAHPSLYDSFLKSVGVDESLFEKPNAQNLLMLQNLQKQIETQSPAYGIGLRGMGGECLCQIYLSAMYENFIKNPFIKERADSIAWKFWEIHTGEEDIHHREVTRNAIDEYLRLYPEALQDFCNGYLKSKIAWDDFWKNIFVDAKAVHDH